MLGKCECECECECVDSQFLCGRLRHGQVTIRRREERMFRVAAPVCLDCKSTPTLAATCRSVTCLSHGCHAMHCIFRSICPTKTYEQHLFMCGSTCLCIHATSNERMHVFDDVVRDVEISRCCQNQDDRQCTKHSLSPRYRILGSCTIFHILQ